LLECIECRQIHRVHSCERHSTDSQVQRVDVSHTLVRRGGAPEDGGSNEREPNEVDIMDCEEPYSGKIGPRRLIVESSHCHEEGGAFMLVVYVSGSSFKHKLIKARIRDPKQHAHTD
jgi:hypothetical protein